MDREEQTLTEEEVKARFGNRKGGTRPRGKVCVKSLLNPNIDDDEYFAYLDALKKMNPKRKKTYRANNPYCLVPRRWDFVKEYIKNGFNGVKAIEATIDQHNLVRNTDERKRRVSSAVMACRYMNDPIVLYAVKHQLYIMNKDITEDYLTTSLLDLEGDAKADGDKKVLIDVYKVMMKLKGLGSEKVVNENIEKSQFSLMSPEELKLKLVEAVRILESSGQLDVDEFIGLLKDKPGELNNGATVEIVAEEVKESQEEESNQEENE